MNSLVNKYLCNNQIRSNFVHLIDNNGVSHGVVNTHDAIDMAKKMDLDLVQVSSEDSSRPICKIMNFGKFKYEMSKVKQSSSHKTKELFISIHIGEHDLKTKLNKLKEFLDKKYSVIFGIKFKNYKEKRNPDLVKDQIRSLLNSIDCKFSEEDFQVSSDKISIYIR